MSDEEEVIVTLDDEPNDTPTEPTEPTEATEPVEPTEPAALTPEQEEEDRQKEIRNKAFENRELKRVAEAERQKREKLEQEIREREAPVRPDIPPMPNFLEDDDYDEKVALRDHLIAERAAYDRELQIQEQMRASQQQDENRKALEAQDARIKDYSKRASDLGVTESDLRLAGSVVASYEISDDVASHILDDEKGPQVTMYLSKNPEEIEKLNTMSATQAAIYIENTIKPVATKATLERTPAPVDTPKGSGYPEEEEHLKYGTVE